MSPKCVIGIDGGATSTKAAAMNLDGEILARAEGLCISPYLLDPATTKANFNDLMDRLLRGADLREVDVAGICLGVSGCDRPDEVAVLEGIARARFPSALAVATNDALVALVGGLGEAAGIITISGTGSISFGINADGRTKRAGGWGHILGDEGSGYEIARQALVATLRAYDGRAPATALSRLIMDHLDLGDPGQIKPWMRRINFEKSAIAAIAPLVFEAEKAGDAVASAIIDTAGRDLADCTCAVATALWNEGALVAVVASGSVILSQSTLFGSFTSHMLERWPNATIHAP